MVVLLDFMFKRLDSRADILSSVLDAVHLGSVLSSRNELSAPWALHAGAVTHRAGFHVVAEGRCWARLDGSDAPIELGAGDLVLFPHGSGHTLSDAPDTPALEFEDLLAGLAPGEAMALPGGGEGDRTVVLCGSYSFSADGANPLLSGLPSLLHVTAAETHGTGLQAAIKLLANEAGNRQSGTALVVDRLVDLIFVYALRTWLDTRRHSQSASWFGALHDTAVAPALRAVHDNPAHPWTVTSLAAEASLSRAVFARRFVEAVGEAPLSYVTRWRMTVATSLLEQGQRIAAVAHRVGYQNEFAFAKAFKRLVGIAPGQVRASARPGRAVHKSPALPSPLAGAVL